MRIMILDRIIEELKQTKETVLYGIQEKNTVIVSSLDQTIGLERIGVFHREKEELDYQEETIVLTIIEGKLTCFELLDDGKSEQRNFEVVNYTTDYNNRNRGIIDESVLQKRTVTIIGLGSGGSAIAEYLTRCGVTNFNFIEFDSISLSNLCRSVYNLADIGRKKTEVMLEKLLVINPMLNIRLYDEDVMKMEHEKLMGIIGSSDVIIEATDSHKTKILINGLAYHSTQVIYPGVYPYGRGGDILFTYPGSACYECVFKDILQDMKEEKRIDQDYATGQSKPMPALIADIQVIVARTVKLALAILTCDTEQSFIGNITEPGCTMLFIGNEKNVSVFDRPFQEAWAETSIEPGCTCQTLM